jgi:hypothetical protein
MQELREKLDPWVEQGTPARREIGEQLAQLEILVKQESLVLSASLASLAGRVRQGTTELRERLDRLGQDPQVIPGKLGLPEMLAILDRLETAAQVEEQVPPVIQGERVLQGALAILDRMASPGPQEALVPPARQAARGIRDLLAILEKLA